MKQSIIFILLIISTLRAFSQEEKSFRKNDVAIIGRSYQDSVVLRWGPTKASTWHIANARGYVIERSEVSREKVASFKIVANLKPYSLAEWCKKADTSNAVVATAAECLLGKPTFDPRTVSGFAGLKKAAEEQEHRFAFAMLSADLNAQAATGLALRFNDKTVEKNKFYVYRIYLNSKKQNEKYDTAYFQISTATRFIAPKVEDFRGDEGDHLITLHWAKAFNDNQFTGYFVEKSTDNQRFTRLNKLPMRSDNRADQASEHFFKDSIKRNEVANYYRIVGITPFGDEGKPSEVLTLKGKDLTGPIPPSQLNVLNAANNTFNLKWSAEYSLSPDHAGYYIGRSISATGPFERLNEKPLSPKTLEFTDTKPIPMLPNYYVIYGVDDKGNENPSMVQIGVHSDNIPPAKPKGIKGEIGIIEIKGEKRGIVTLTWDMNTEQDLLGYRIFTANAKNREFYEVSHAPNSTPFYLDTITLNTLSKKIYYKIFANDFNMNVSEYSDILTLDVPDIIAPVAPVFRSYAVDEKNIVLTWENSHSKDVLSQKIWRKENAKNWQLLAEIKDNTTAKYSDSTAIIGITYEYALETTDDAALNSGKSPSLLVTKYDNGKRLTINNIKGEFNKETKCFQLTWDYNISEKSNFKYVIYRAIKAGEWTAYGATSDKTFSDKHFFYQEDGYAYAVKVVYNDGGESELSEALVVKF